MFHVFLVIHCLLCISLVILVLLQQGKGADMGAALGGSSSTVFGASGATDFFTKLTTSIAVAFMVTSIALVRLYSSQGVSPTSTADPLQDSVMQGEAVKLDAAPAPQAAPAEAPAAAEVKPAEVANTAAQPDVAAEKAPQAVAEKAAVVKEKAEVKKVQKKASKK